MSAPPVNTAALELQDVRSGYGSALVVRGVSLAGAPGEIVVVLGKNGMGKTTLLRTVMGFLAVRQGVMHIGGTDVAASPVHRRAGLGVAYVPQEKALFQDLPVRDNLRLAVAHDRDLQAGLERVRGAFPFLMERMDQPAGTLSGGEQKMLLIARALMPNPKLLLIDEVTEGLQPSVIDRLAGILRAAARQDGRAILLVEQHIGFALAVADRFAVMKLGEIVAEGSTQDPDAQRVIEEQMRI